MKKVLILLATSLCISLTLNAQTISSTVTTTTVELGSSLTAMVTYTATDNSIAVIQLSKYNGDNKGDQVFWMESPVVMPGTATISLTGNVPTSTTPTSMLADGESYKLSVRLLTTGYLDIVSENPEKVITLTGTATIAPTIDTVVPMFTSVELGGALTVDVTYTSTTANVHVVAVNLRKYYPNGPENPLWVAYGDVTIATPSTGSNTGTISINIPASTMPTSSFTNGENYKIDVTLVETEDDGTWKSPPLANFIHPMEITLTAATALGIEDINANSIVMYPNPVSDILRIKNSGISEIRSFQIVDILGQVVIKQNNDTKVNQIDVSELSKGLYFLISNNNRQFKFLKK